MNSYNTMRLIYKCFMLFKFYTVSSLWGILARYNYTSYLYSYFKYYLCSTFGFLFKPILKFGSWPAIIDDILHVLCL